MDLTSRPNRAPGFHLEVMDDEVLLYHPQDNKLIQFNQTAALIWQLCDGQHTVVEMIQMLQQAYPDSAHEIAEDVQDVLQQCQANGCIQFP